MTAATTARRVRFAAAPQPTRVVFGPGRLDELGQEVERLGWSRVLVLSTPGHVDLAERAAGLLGDRTAGVHAGAVMHVPVPAAEAAVDAAGAVRADGAVAVGGGSTTGLAKALARRAGIPYLAVPTTFSGSEMTPVWGETADGVKRTGRDERVRAATVLYDPELTRTLPSDVAVTSAVNALAHAAEALYAPDASPLSDAVAARAVGAAVAALPHLLSGDAGVADAARAELLAAAWLSGMCLASTTSGLHHKLAHVLGGARDLPHAPTHTVLLPYVLAHVLPAAPAAREALGADLGPDPARALRDLSLGLGAPGDLAGLGLREQDLDPVVRAVLAAPPPSPRPLTAGGVRAVLRAALTGDDVAAAAGDVDPGGEG